MSLETTAGVADLFLCRSGPISSMGFATGKQKIDKNFKTKKRRLTQSSLQEHPWQCITHFASLPHSLQPLLQVSFITVAAEKGMFLNNCISSQ